MRILIYTGKGGVGKTSLAAATALRLAQSGKRVLVMSTDMAHSLGDAFGLPLCGEPTAVVDGLEALEIDPAEESRKAWGNLRDYLKQIIAEKANGGIAADEALLFPGLEELFALLRILDACEEGRYDAIVVDCAPTGETLALLRYPERLSVLADKLLPAVRSFNNALGSLISRKTTVPKPRDEVFKEFDGLVKRLTKLQNILRDRSTTSLRIVSTPERIVLDEARRSYTWIQLYDFGVDAVYLNKIYPDEALQGYFEDWIGLQKESIRLAQESFARQKLFYLPLQPDELRGIAMLSEVAESLYADCDPAQVFCTEQAFRIEEDSGTRIFVVTLPYANAEHLQVRKEKGDLILSYRNEMRRFHLPDKLNRRILTGWDYADGELRIRMDYD